MLDKSLKSEISGFIDRKSPVVIFSHVNPDGDAIGSSTALALFLKKMGVPVDIIIPNGLPDFLKWLPGSEIVTVYTEKRHKAKELIGNAEVMFFLDFNEPGRLEKLEKDVLKSSAYKIMIDHHVHPERFTDAVISESWRSSVGEMIYEFIIELSGKEMLDHDIATCLYVAIMTDTGNFRYASSYSGVFHIAGELMNYDIDKDYIFSKVYDSFSQERMRLLGYCMQEKMVVIEEYNTAYISIAKEELKRFKHSIGDTEGFVNVPFSIKDIRFTALFIEKEGYVKASFRSKGSFSVDSFAVDHFNGGGHVNAAGGEFRDSMENTLKKFNNLLALYKDELSAS